MSKVPKKILKILKHLGISVGIVLIFFTVSTALLLNTEWGKNYSGDILAVYIENLTGSKVEIGDINIGWRVIGFNRVVVYDHKNNLLFKFTKGKLYYRNFRQPFNRVVFRRLDIDSLYLNGVNYKGDYTYNFILFLRKIQNNQGKNKGTAKRIIVREINLTHSEIWLQKEGRSNKPGKIDFNKFGFRNVDSKISDFNSYKSKISFKCKHFTAVESDGLEIIKLALNCQVDTNMLAFSNIVVETPKSHIKGDLTFEFKNYKDFLDIISKIHLDGSLENSKINFNDLAYFGKKIQTNLKDFVFSGKLSGYIDNIKIRDLKMKFGKNSSFEGDARFSGLPVLSETLIDFKTSKSFFNFEDIQGIFSVIKLPVNLTTLGNIRYTGRFTGFINDFVANGSFSTGIGNLYSDLNLKIPLKGGTPSYSGTVTLDNFDLGKLFHASDKIGRASLTGNISGKGFSLKNVDASFDFQADHLEIKNYPYQNVIFKGHLVQTDFSGGVYVNDPNIYLDFNGKIDLSNEKPVFKYKAVVKNADLQKLNLTKEKFTLSCSMDINIQARNQDDAIGSILITNAYLGLTKGNYHLENLEIHSAIKQNIKNLTINSDVANVMLSGKFNIFDIPYLLQNTLADYLDPSFHLAEKKNVSDQYLSFNIDLLNNSLLNQFIRLKFLIDDNVHLEGYFSPEGKTNISAFFPGIKYKDFKITNLRVSAISSQFHVLVFQSEFEKLEKNDSSLVKNGKLLARCNQDSTIVNLEIENDRYDSKLVLNGSVKFNRDSAILFIRNSQLKSNDVVWDISSKTINIHYTPRIEIALLELKNPTESLKILGVISNEKNSSLRIIPDNLSLDHITQVINNKRKFDFSGRINGQVMVHNILGYSYFDAALAVYPLIYRDYDSLGTLRILTTYTELTKKNLIQLSLENENLDKILSLEGDIDLSHHKDLDLTLNIVESNLNIVQPFVRGLFSNMNGKIKGKVIITGNVSQPRVNGIINVSGSEIRIDYLNTRYYFSQDFPVDEKGITINNVKVRDEFGNQAIVNGSVKFRGLNKYYLDLIIRAKNIYSLNTSESQNSFYHGQAYASGTVTLSGFLDRIKMDITARSEPHTSVILTTYGVVNSSQYPFIRYTNKNDNAVLHPTVNTKGMTVNMKLEITPDADFQVWLDPEMNDMIKGNGTGNIKLEADYLGNISMYGNFFIDHGEYRFSAMNLIKRNFEVVSGSRITWSGDPMNIRVKLDATCNMVANIDDLLKGEYCDPKYTTLGQTVPVVAKLTLTESLFKPDIKLDFDIVSSKSISSTNLCFDKNIRDIKNDEEELEKQVISLLAIGRFQPINSGIQTQNNLNEGISSNVGSLLSTRVSSWLSGFSNYFDSKYISNIQLGMNVSTDSKLTQNQLELIAGANFINNRFNVTGSYDLQNINNNFEASYLTKNNKLRLKIFTKMDNNPIYQQNINRKGVGITVKKDFERLFDIEWRKNKKKSN